MVLAKKNNNGSLDPYHAHLGEFVILKLTSDIAYLVNLKILASAVQDT